jgi:hypothetical protein
MTISLSLIGHPSALVLWTPCPWGIRIPAFSNTCTRAFSSSAVFHIFVVLLAIFVISFAVFTMYSHISAVFLHLLCEYFRLTARGAALFLLSI